MRLRVLLLPVLVPLGLLGFVMAQVGENKDNATRPQSTKLNLVTRSEVDK
jgi:hypothetical protein